MLAKVDRKTASQVAHAIIELLIPVKDSGTITSDCGKEFAHHQQIASELDADFYFAHSDAAWEHRLNENISGLAGQYFPKKCDFRRIGKRQVEHVMKKLNNRPGKSLGFKTANGVSFGIEPDVAPAS